MRDIDHESIGTCFFKAYGFAPSTVAVDEVCSFLRYAVVDVDNSPETPTHRELQSVSSAAKKLSDKLSALPAGKDMLLEIAFQNPDRPMEINDLYRWLVFLQQPERFFQRKSPSQSYRSVIRRLADACADDSTPISKTENSAFLSFLNNLEERWPGLIFPSGTVPSGRRDYLRESLTD